MERLSKLWSDKIYQPYRKYDGVLADKIPVTDYDKMLELMALSRKEWMDYFEGVPIEVI